MDGQLRQLLEFESFFLDAQRKVLIKTAPHIVAFL